MQPPARFAHDRFASYKVLGPTQAAALEEAKHFVEHIRTRQPKRSLRRLFGSRKTDAWKGLYLVGPVGTGKTHLLASMYHALHPGVPCAFMHSSALFRVTEHPQAFARRIARTYRVLCLDEIELDDPANEARLILVLKSLEDLGVFLLATSNVEPEKFLSGVNGNDRFRRFLNEEFRKHYKVIFVGGEDYRRKLSKPGRAWIGPPPLTRTAMREAFDADARERCWMDFDELLHTSLTTEHTRLVKRLAGHESLYLADVTVRDADDALRLLRIIDDLYQLPDPPVLHFTSETAPDDWLNASDLHSALERGIAEKFTRTASRLHALCDLEFVGPDRGQADRVRRLAG